MFEERLRILLCLLGFHDFEYNLTYDPRTHSRTCEHCGKHWGGCYDMTYGGTIWTVEEVPDG